MAGSGSQIFSFSPETSCPGSLRTCLPSRGPYSIRHDKSRAAASPHKAWFLRSGFFSFPGQVADCFDSHPAVIERRWFPACGTSATIAFGSKWWSGVMRRKKIRIPIQRPGGDPDKKAQTDGYRLADRSTYPTTVREDAERKKDIVSYPISDPRGKHYRGCPVDLVPFVQGNGVGFTPDARREEGIFMIPPVYFDSTEGAQ